MNTTAHNQALSKSDALAQAKDFLLQYYSDTVNHAEPKVGHAEREREVLRELMMNGTYELTHDETEWGARMAWRNAPRCPARIIWKKLRVFDRVSEIRPQEKIYQYFVFPSETH